MSDMKETIEQRLARAMADLETTTAAVAEAEAELSHASCTIRSQDRSVEVTVSAQGDLTDVRFLEGKYRTMPAGQLAASVLEAAQEARAVMARRVMETFEPFTRPHESVPELPGVNRGSSTAPRAGTAMPRRADCSTRSTRTRRTDQR
jgi:DNA-binding protein YbaB